MITSFKQFKFTAPFFVDNSGDVFRSRQELGSLYIGSLHFENDEWIIIMSGEQYLPFTWRELAHIASVVEEVNKTNG